MTDNTEEGSIEWSPKQAEVLDYVRGLPTSVPHSDSSATAGAYMLLKALEKEIKASVGTLQDVLKQYLEDGEQPEFEGRRIEYQSRVTTIYDTKTAFQTDPNLRDLLEPFKLEKESYSVVVKLIKEDS